MSFGVNHASNPRHGRPGTNYAWDGDKVYASAIAKFDLSEKLALQEGGRSSLSTFIFRTGELCNWLAPLQTLWPYLHAKADEYRSRTKYRSLTSVERATLCAKDRQYSKKDDDDQLTNVERTILLADYMRDILIEHLTAA